jgi:hypothetical protein
MRRSSGSFPRLLAAVVAAAVAAAAIAAVALAAGGAHSSAVTVRIKCPKRIQTGQRVRCRLFNGVVRGPRGPRGNRGPAGAKGKTGKRGPAGPAGVSQYQVISQPINDVSVPKSEGGRGLSSTQTVGCPSNKRVIGGGANLGTDEAQAAAQRDVTVSLSAPSANGGGWSVQLFNASTTEDHTIDLLIYAICAKTG